MKLRETLERDPGYLCLSPRNATSQLGTLPSGNGRRLSIAAVRPVHEAVQGTRAPMPWGWLCHVPVPGALSSSPELCPRPRSFVLGGPCSLGVSPAEVSRLAHSGVLGCSQLFCCVASGTTLL